jgi:hypothetical protein
MFAAQPARKGLPVQSAFGQVHVSGPRSVIPWQQQNLIDPGGGDARIGHSAVLKPERAEAVW